MRHLSAQTGIDIPVVQSFLADKVYGATGLIRADFQTEHVLETQNIGNFFTYWLATGKLRNQLTAVTARRAGGVSLSQWLMSELGSITNQDRLTVLMTRINGIKGNLFMGKRGIDPTGRYQTYTPEGQLLAVKDLGTFDSYKAFLN